MRAHVAILIAAIGCGGTQKTPDDPGPGTEGIVDDTAGDIAIVEAPPVKLCVDMAMFDPEFHDFRDEDLTHPPTTIEAEMERTEALEQLLDAHGDARHAIVGLAQIAANTWAFIYTRCTGLPECASYMARADYEGTGYSISREQALPLDELVSNPESLSVEVFGVGDLNADGDPELWAILAADGAQGELGYTTRTYLSVYSVPDLHALLWTQMGFSASHPQEDACAYDFALHDLDCDEHADVLVSTTCGTQECVNTGGPVCPADGLFYLRTAHIWKPDAGIYHVSEHPWTPTADGYDPVAPD